MAKNKLEEELRKKQKSLLSGSVPTKETGVNKNLLALSIAAEHDAAENVKAKQQAGKNKAAQQAKAIAEAHDAAEITRKSKAEIAKNIAAEHDYNEDVKAAQKRRTVQIAQDIANTHDFTENTKGTAFGNVSPQANAAITGLQEIWQKAKAQGDLEKAQKAHQAAEAMRVLFGFSGGKDGSQMIKMQKPTGLTEDVRTRLVKQGYEAMQEAQQPTVVHYKPSHGALGLPESVSEEKSVLGNLLGLAGRNTMAGISQFNAGLAKTADLFLPDVITPKFVQNTLDWYKDDAERTAQETAQENYERGGKAGQLAGTFYQGMVSSAPQAILAMLTAGGSTAQSAIDTLQRAGTSPGILSALQAAFRNPSYWTAFAQTVGGDYEDAIANGANEAQALTTALTSSLIGAGIEISGGVEEMAKNTGKIGIGSVLKSAASEGLEEVEQGVTTGLAHKAAYDRDRAWYSGDDPNAVLNPGRMAQEFAGGAIAGGVLSGGGAFLHNAAAPKTQTLGQENTSVHMPEMERTMMEYEAAVDENLKGYTEDVLNKKMDAPKWFEMKKVTSREADDIKNAIGVDANGFKTKIEKRAIEHIWKDHGSNGVSDQSMADVSDIARIQYVIDNYDTIEDGGRADSYKEPNPNMPGKNRSARTVLYTKQIDGHMYVVRAVPDTSRKTSYIVSAFRQKNRAPKILNAPNGAPGFTSKNASEEALSGDSYASAIDAEAPSLTPEAPLASPVPVNNIITRDAEVINHLQKISANSPGTLPQGVWGEKEVRPQVKAEEDRVSAALRVLGLGQRMARGEAAAEAIRRAHDPNALPELNQSAGGLRAAHRSLVSGVAELERLAKLQKEQNANAVNAEDLVQMSRAAGGTVDAIAGNALVDRKGDSVGESWADTVGKLTEEESRRLNLYRQHLHNIDRMSFEADAKKRLAEVRGEIELLVELNPEYAGMTESELMERSHWSRLPEDDKKIISDYLALLQEERRLASVQNKPILSYVNRDGDEMPYTAEQSREEAAKMLQEHPELREQTAAAEAFHDRFMREWAVGSGLMSEQQYNALRAKYPHYIQTFRVNQQSKGGDSVTRKGGVNTTDPIRKAVGDISEIVPFEDAEMMQVNSIVRMARRNELFRNLYDFAKANPKDAAPYVRILDKETLAEIDATEGFEALSEALEANAMQAKNGSYTLMAMIDGKPVKMQVSPDLYAGLQHLYGQDRSAAEEAFAGSVGKVTTGFKMLTTGWNPFFPITNLAKDLQTGYINTVSDRKTFVTYLLRDVAVALDDMTTADSRDWQNFKALGGKSSGFYHNEKGFKESLALDKKALSWDTIKDFLGVVGESTESLIRFAEYKAAVRKYGDTQEGRAKAIQAAADVTVNFSRSAPMTRAAENFVPYLNASVQGLDKMVRQYKAHPVQATRRNLEMLTLTTVILWLINKDDEDYQNLNNRTKDNYFCIPVGRTADWIGLEELGAQWEGKFLKIPKSREWGAAFSALMERFLRWVGGEDADEAFEGIAGQFFTNVIPSNPVTDNIGKSVFIDLPTNKDFAGRDIVPQRLQGLSPENQYDYSTSDAGKAVAGGWNAVADAVNQIPGVDVPKLAPAQADYLIDSNLGFVGDAILAYDKDNPPTAAGVGKHVLDTLEQKFIADPRYQNGATDHFYNILHAAEVAKNDVNLEKELDSRVVTPEEKYYSLLKEHADAIFDLRKQERGLLASDMDEAEREKQVLAIRDQILDIANNAPAKAQADLEAYKATYVPEISHLSDEKQEQARAAHDETGLSYDAFVRFTDDLSAYEKETKGQEKDTAADVAGILRGYSGLTDEQRDRLFSVYSENMAVNPFHVSRYEAGMDKSGLYAELTDAGKSEIRALLNDYEQDIDAGKAEAGKLDDWKAKAYTAEQEAGIAPDLYAQYRVALQIANTDGNTNYSQTEAEKAVRMLGEIGSEKQAYLFASTNSQWKKNPFGSADVSKYEAAEKEAEEKPELLQEDSKVRDILNALVSTGSSAKSSAGSKPQKLKTLKTLDVLKPLKNLF